MVSEEEVRSHADPHEFKVKANRCCGLRDTCGKVSQYPRITHAISFRTAKYLRYRNSDGKVFFPDSTIHSS